MAKTAKYDELTDCFPYIQSLAPTPDVAKAIEYNTLIHGLKPAAS